MKKNSQVTDELLVKYLLGEASGAEQAQVQQWLEERRENKQYYDEFKLIWSQSRHLAAESTVDENEAWARFKQRTERAPGTTKVIPVQGTPYKWIRIAAVFLLLAGGGWLTWFITNKDNVQVITHSEIKENSVAPRDTETQPVAIYKKDTANLVQTDSAKPKDDKLASVTVKKEPFTPQGNRHSVPDPEAKKYICNGTPCPLEICITQTVKCYGGQAAEYASCSTLGPDESGQISLKMFDKLAKNCSLNISEIKITRVSTGESIILNAHSTPSTAQDLFNYITGKKKGDILAGTFQSDCGDEASHNILRFDNNNYGHLILQ